MDNTHTRTHTSQFVFAEFLLVGLSEVHKLSHTHTHTHTHLYTIYILLVVLPEWLGLTFVVVVANGLSTETFFYLIPPCLLRCHGV